MLSVIETTGALMTRMRIALARGSFLPCIVLLMETRQRDELSRVLCRIPDVWPSLRVLILSLVRL